MTTSTNPDFRNIQECCKEHCYSRSEPNSKYCGWHHPKGKAKIKKDGSLELKEERP